MGQITIKYEEVYSKTTELRSHINSDLLNKIENEYNQIRSLIEQVDGATIAALKETMNQNQQKAVMVATTLDKLLSFMANSSKQVQLNEEIMANKIISGAQNASGGEK